MEFWGGLGGCWGGLREVWGGVGGVLRGFGGGVGVERFWGGVLGGFMRGDWGRFWGALGEY